METMEFMICPDCGDHLLMDGDHTERDCWEVQARKEYEGLSPAWVPDYDEDDEF